MRSFTSNSENKTLLITIFLTTFIALSSYHYLIVSGVIKPGVGESPGKDNLITVEKFMNATEKCDVVLAGSSLMAKISEAGLPGGWESLSVKGSSSIVGLRILLLTHRKPRIVIAEIGSSLIRDAEHNPALRVAEQPNILARLSPMFSVKYQPVSVLVSLFASRKAEIEQLRVKAKHVAIDKFLSQKKSPPTKEELQKLVSNVQVLKDQIGKLESQGVQIWLVRIPGEELIDKTPYEVAVDSCIDKVLGLSPYRRLEPRDGLSWHTSDAVHLTSMDAHRFLGNLRRELVQKCQTRKELFHQRMLNWQSHQHQLAAQCPEHTTNNYAEFHNGAHEDIEVHRT